MNWGWEKSPTDLVNIINPKHLCLKSLFVGYYILEECRSPVQTASFDTFNARIGRLLTSNTWISFGLWSGFQLSQRDCLVLREQSQKYLLPNRELISKKQFNKKAFSRLRFFSVKFICCTNICVFKRFTMLLKRFITGPTGTTGTTG